MIVSTLTRIGIALSFLVNITSINASINASNSLPTISFLNGQRLLQGGFLVYFMHFSK